MSHPDFGPYPSLRLTEIVGLMQDKSKNFPEFFKKIKNPEKNQGDRP